MYLKLIFEFPQMIEYRLFLYIYILYRHNALIEIRKILVF